MAADPEANPAACAELQENERYIFSLVKRPRTLDNLRKAALIENLDLVVSVDTSIAHLAGALGRPVWILLPCAADWRWGVAGAATAWYPTATLFRQRAVGGWTPVVADVMRALDDRPTKHSTR